MLSQASCCADGRPTGPPDRKFTESFQESGTHKFRVFTKEAAAVGQALCSEL